METAQKESIRLRIFLATYATMIFYCVLFAKMHYSHKALEILENAGYIEKVREGPLNFLGQGVFSLGLPIFVSIVLLPQLLQLVRIKDGALQRCLFTVTAFWVFSLLAYCSTRLDVAYIAYFMAYGGLIGLIEGIYKTPMHPVWLDDKNLTCEGKCEMLKFEDDKWWKGLNLFWMVVIGIVVMGVINWIGSATPEEGTLKQLPALKLQIALILVISAVPGIASIIWNIFQRSNYIQRELGKAYTGSKTG